MGKKSWLIVMRLISTSSISFRNLPFSRKNVEHDVFSSLLKLTKVAVCLLYILFNQISINFVEIRQDFMKL